MSTKDDEHGRRPVVTPPKGTPLHQRAITERGPRERDLERDRQRPKHAPALTPAFVEEDVTGRLEGEELQVARGKRPTDQRISRLEVKHDKLDEKVDEIRVSVAGIAGQMKVIPDLFESLRDELKARREDDHVKLTTTLDVGRHEAISRIDTQAFKVKARWKLVLKVAGIIAAPGVVGAAIMFLAQRC